MAVTGLLALLDDVAATLDDVAALSHHAAQSTAGLAGDDLAVNAQNLVGIDPSRELPIIGKVFVGAIANKFVLVPIALLLPTAAITPLLMCGGTFLCYEGVHKVAEGLGIGHHDDDDHHPTPAHDPAAAPAPKLKKKKPIDVAAFEKKRVKQAIVTDIILSAEIVAVTLGTVATEPLGTRAGVLAVVALGMTCFIYGLVAGLVKLDDIGLHLKQRGGNLVGLGEALIVGTPILMKCVSVGGTLAMFLVGGGIILHGWHAAEHVVHGLVTSITHNPTLELLLTTTASGIFGLLIGIGVVLVVDGIIKRGIAAVRGSSEPAH